MMLKLPESDKEIERKILIAVSQEMNKRVKRNQGKIRRDFEKLISIWVRQSQEIQSLKSEAVQNTLNSEFGLVPGQGSILEDQIVESIVGSIQIEVQQFDSNLNGGISVYIQPTDFENLLGITDGFIRSENSPLHFLHWLLVEGDKILIVGYKYVPMIAGRSKGGIMRSKTGGSFRVKPEFAGTAENNFVTRAFDNRDRDVFKVLERVIK
ncbi:MAG: hypothetical protein ABGX31_00680 [bacterium]